VITKSDFVPWDIALRQNLNTASINKQIIMLMAMEDIERWNLDVDLII
jgi:hypothetical protein